MNDAWIGRVEKIEAAVAHLENQFDQLNQVVIEQGRLLKRLQGQQEKMDRSLSTVELERIKATNPKPPHYQ